MPEFYDEIVHRFWIKKVLNLIAGAGVFEMLCADEKSNSIFRNVEASYGFVGAPYEAPHAAEHD